ncbi:MAG: FAD-dependent oxidoreductase, partial [Herbaspirillum sp.]
MKVIVLGAGIIGTASAYFLNKAGHEVTVIERQPGAAQETSFANGCQISVSHAEPWANPSAPLKVLKWLGHEDAPLLYRFRPEWLQWKWAMSFLRECTPARTARNIRQIVSISEYSRQVLQELRADTGIQYDCLTKGILHFYTEQKEFDNSIPVAKLMRELGCERNSISADEVVKIEPALARIRDKIVGGDFTASDESGDVYKLVSGLANTAAGQGVDFKYNTTLTRFITEGSGVTRKIVAVEVIDPSGQHQRLYADNFVVALG